MTVMAGEETRLRINASAEDESEESVSSMRVHPRGAVSDTDISSNRDMRAAQVHTLHSGAILIVCYSLRD